MTTRRLLGVWLVASASYLLPSGALAEPADDAARYFQNGLRHAQAGEFDQAVREFEDAYRVSPHYSVLYNIAQTLALMGRPAEAVDAFQRYLRQGGNAIDSRRRGQVEADITYYSKRLGKLELDVEPSQATLELDGQAVHQGARAALQLAAGRHGLVLRAPGFRLHTASVLVEPGKTALVRARLEPIEDPLTTVGVLQLRCAVPGVTVFLDERTIGETPIVSPITVIEGDHHVRFARPGYLASEHQSHVKNREVVDVVCALKPLPPSKQTGATVAVRVNEPRSAITLDGEHLVPGVVTAGPHRLEVSRAGFRSWRRDVYFAPGSKNDIDVHLQPEPEYVAEYRAQVLRQRTLAYLLFGGGAALGATSLTLWLVNRNASADLQRQKDALEGAVVGPGLEGELEALHRQSIKVQRLNDWTGGFLLGGLALAGAGTAVWFSAGDPAKYGKVSTRVGSNGPELNWRWLW